ncbi:MAG: methyltransferase domain-containing protein [Acidimicrobiales bacterium]
MAASGDAALKASQAANFDNLNEVVADSKFDRHLRFFNFGYRPLGDDEPVGPRLGPGFPNQDSAQLLFQVIGPTDLTGARVVEVGCGRGGNLWLLRRHYGTAAVVGADIAYKSVAFCRRSMPEDDAQFVVADAERVPLGSGIADAVVSVETSCTYPDIEWFFRDVARMVKVGGHFLYTDLLLTALVDPFVAVLEQLGFELEHRRDITANVCASRDARAARQKLAFGETPDADEVTMAEFVGREGSRLYDSLTDGEHQYTILRFRKAASVEPPAERLLAEPIAALVREQAQLAVELLTIPSR